MISPAIEKAHSVGITTLHALDGGFGAKDQTVEEFLAAIPTLPLRFVLYFQTMDVDKVLGLGLPRIGGCILLDGDLAQPEMECVATLASVIMDLTSGEMHVARGEPCRGDYDTMSHLGTRQWKMLEPQIPLVAQRFKGNRCNL